MTTTSCQPGRGCEPVLAARGFTATGSKVLLRLVAGSKEDAETISALFQDTRDRGLGDSLLVVSDDAPGIVKAIETCCRSSDYSVMNRAFFPTFLARAVSG